MVFNHNRRSHLVLRAMSETREGQMLVTRARKQKIRGETNHQTDCVAHVSNTGVTNGGTP